MSGYRILHRFYNSANDTKGKEVKVPTWSLSFSPCVQSRSKPKPPVTTAANPPLRLLSCHADGSIQAHTLHEKDILSSPDIMDATALEMEKQGELHISNVTSNDLNTGLAPMLGSCQISIIRNHTGESITSGDEVSASISLDGSVCLWERKEQPIYVPSSSDDTTTNHPNNCNDIEIQKPVVQFYIEIATGTNIALSPPSWGGKYLLAAIGCRDGSVVLYDTGIIVPTDGNNSKNSATGQVLTHLTEKKSMVISLAFSPNGMYLAIGRKDGSIDIFSVSKNVSDFRRIHHVVAHSGMVRAVEFTIDNALLLSGGDDGEINAYDIVRRKQIALVGKFVGHKSWILDISACPDGRRFASSSSDKTIRIWDLSMRNSMHTFEGHTDQVWCISFNHDGTRLASCGDDGLIQIYSCDI